MAKRYIVTGSVAQFGHRPGEEFEADLSEAAEQRAVARGGIAIAQDGDGLSALKREELNSLATEAGVESPESLSNKDEVIEAIRAATTEPEESGSNDQPKE